MQAALNCAERFHHAPEFANYREGSLQWELPVSFPPGGITFNGVVDLVGEDFVLDFKSDRTIHPEHHSFSSGPTAKRRRNPTPISPTCATIASTLSLLPN